MSDTARPVFREWLKEALERHEVSRRELARRLAERDPSDGDPETHRRSIRRILDGTILSPTQPTRDAIQDALGDETAPTVQDEDRSEADAMEALARQRVAA